MMHLTELAEITEAEIEVEYFHVQRKFTARLKGAEVLEGENGGVLSSTRGRGTTPEMAQRNYAKQIAGKRIAFGMLSGPRREYNVPKSLSF
jgi:hypothetical protein